jgi:Subunit ChlI of Mg-chelatase
MSTRVQVVFSRAGIATVQRVSTVAFEGIEARAVDVQVQVAPGMPAFNVVGLPDKAVSEARERVRAALIASGLALPARRITVNLAPADLPKEGSHYDLPIALGLMAAIGAIPADALSGFTVLGELGLDGSVAPVTGVLPAAIGANGRAEGLIRPVECGPEAAWASPDMEIIAASSLIQLANHFRGTQVLSRPQPKVREVAGGALDLKDIKGQESAQACARDRGCGRAQSADVRPARCRQVDARRTTAVDPAAARADRIVGNIDDRVGRRRDCRRGADQPAAIPGAASFRQHAGAGRRRPARQAG